jgi:protease-4
MLDRATDATRTVVTQIEEARRRRTAPILLELDLTEPLVEGVPQDPLTAMMARRRASLRAVLEGLHKAARDPRVKGLIARLGGSRSPLALARAQELREAVRDFRSQDKPAIAWAETFGEFGQGSVPYYLATAFDEIWLQPSGDVCLTGVGAQVPFLRGVLDKVGVTPQLAQRHEYKNAANLFTETGFTEAHREATERLVASAMEQLVTGIADGRRLDVDQVRAFVDRAPLFADEALAAGLVDRIGYRDEVYADVRTRVGEDAILQYVGRYGRSPMAELAKRVKPTSDGAVALVHVTGGIHLGKSGRRPLSGSSAGSDTVTAALRAAAKDDSVKAVVLRVTSPGGSYVASDAIWRHVGQLRATGRPVVVSMGDVAASGGYFVSMGADAIVAEPGTVTGSIGVVSGKQVVDELADRIGISHEEVAGAEHALMFSALQEFSADEWDRLNTWLDRIYDDFTAKVAAGRGLAVDRVHEVARGRVWTGADAKERGLVDQLGGLADAIDLARERAGIPAAAEPDVRVYPRVPMLARLKPAQSSEDPAAAGVGPGADLRLLAWGEFAGLATRLGLPAFGPLTLPGDWSRLGS